MFTAYYSKPFGIELPGLSQYCDALQCTVLHFSTLYYTVLHCIVLHCFTLYYTVLHCTVLHCSTLYYTVLHCTALQCSTLYSSCQLCKCLILEVKAWGFYLLFCIFSSVSSLLYLPRKAKMLYQRKPSCKAT